MRRRISHASDRRAYLTPDRLQQLSKLQKLIKTQFLDVSLLDQAFTHRSFANETNFKIEDNERLEFLGDSVLGFFAASILYDQFKDIREGSLAKMKSKLVSGPVLSQICKNLGLMEFIRFGKGEKDSGIKNERVMENLVEALIGAIYLDQGLDKCKSFISPHLKKNIDELNDLESVRDYKSLLQEQSQRLFKRTPKYTLVSDDGLDHDKIFVVRVEMPDGSSVNGTGKNKRSAEHAAAKKYLHQGRK
ncbi:MAG: ribonuclease III [Leptospira sp.]|nr:ribonuclease III [Leptospira sp.]NCS93215.1 ribonuclease III [Leptospira sp.]